MYIGFHVKYLLLLSDFNKNLIFSSEFWKKTEIFYLIKIGLVGAEVFHAE
jgi:hypothetical protein